MHKTGGLRSRPAWEKKARHFLQNTQSKKGRRNGSSSRAKHEFKPQFHQNQNQTKTKQKTKSVQKDQLDDR
jgi:hypothetical protein